MRSTAHWPQVVVDVTREEIPVSTMSPDRVPDERWHYLDKKGHGHFYEDGKTPTLQWVVTGTEAVGDEYEMTEYDVGEWRCRLCGEVVEPGMRSEWPKPIMGLTYIDVTIDGEQFSLTPDQYADSIAAWAKALRKIAAMREP